MLRRKFINFIKKIVEYITKGGLLPSNTKKKNEKQP